MPARSLQVTFYVTAREQRGSVRLSAQTLNFNLRQQLPVFWSIRFSVPPLLSARQLAATIEVSQRTDDKNLKPLSLHRSSRSERLKRRWRSTLSHIFEASMAEASVPRYVIGLCVATVVAAS